jgi:MFS family permease
MPRLTDSTSPETPPSPPDAGGPLTRAFASFSLPAYRRYFAGQGISLTGSWMRSAALGWLVYDLTGSEAALGTVTAAYNLPLVLAPAAGALADRVDKRALFRWLSLVAMTISLGLAAVVGAGAATVPIVQAFALALGILFAIEMPTRQSWIAEFVGREHLANALALNSAMFNTARFIGPALAGPLLEAGRHGVAACFALDGLSYLAVVFALGRIHGSAAPPAPGPRAPWMREILEGFRFARGSVRVRTLLLLLTTTLLCVGPYTALLPSFARREFHLGGRGFALLVAAGGLGSCLGALFVAATPTPAGKRALRAQVFGCVLAFAACIAAFTRVASPWAAAGLLVAGGFFVLAFVSRSNTLVQLATPDRLRGRVMGLWALSFGASTPLGALAVGVLAERVGPRDAVALASAAGAVLAVGLWAFLPPVGAAERTEAAGA